MEKEPNTSLSIIEATGEEDRWDRALVLPGSAGINVNSEDTPPPITFAAERIQDAVVFSTSPVERQPVAQLFLEFLLLGMQAWGGPWRRSQSEKSDLWSRRKWISPKHFNRVQGVYQLIPGPEATSTLVS